MDLIIFPSTVFEWDRGNREKNQKKHGVSPEECEEVFFNTPLLVADDHAHSMKEPRWYVLGKTNNGKQIFLVFTRRKQAVRVISARPMSKRERSIYAKAKKYS